jgi:DNA-binding transcriptional MerR regulator
MKPWEEATKTPATAMNPALETVRSGLQGMTFGLSDEIGAFIAALPPGDEPLWKRYETIHRQINDKHKKFVDEHGGTAAVAEILGAVATGGAGFSRLLGGKGYQAASGLGKVGRIAGVGGVEGGIYGGASADPGERMEGGQSGALMGATMAPIGAGAVNAIGRGGGAIATALGRRVTDTAHDKARRALVKAAEDEGLSVDEIVRRMDVLGPQGILADMGDSFRSLTRAGMDNPGPMKTQARKVVNQRQRSQQRRIQDTLAKATGKDASEYRQTVQKMISDREEASAPLYKEAFVIGVEDTPGLIKLKSNPEFKGAFAKGNRWAKAEGKENDLLTTLHYAKQNLDDRIGAAIRKGKTNEARILMGRKRELLDEVAAQNPEYIRAMNVFSDHMSIANALDLGLDFLKKDADVLKMATESMTGSEFEMFRRGAVKSVSNMLDNTQQNADAARKLIGTQAMRDRLSMLFDNPEDFARRIGTEAEFTMTRNSLMGGPNTAERLSAQQSLRSTVAPDLMMSMATSEPSSLIPAFAKMLNQGEATPEMIQELGNMLLKRGMSREEIMSIFKSPMFKESLGDSYNSTIAPIVRSTMAPGIEAYRE